MKGFLRRAGFHLGRVLVSFGLGGQGGSPEPTVDARGCGHLQIDRTADGDLAIAPTASGVLTVAPTARGDLTIPTC